MWTRLAAFVCGLLICAGASTAAAGAPPASAALRARGLELGYNLDHAERSPPSTRRLRPTRTIPAGYRLGRRDVDHAVVRAGRHHRRRLPRSGASQRATVTLRQPRSTCISRRRFSQALTLSEQRLRTILRDADAHYQVGAASGFLASYTATVEGRLLGSLGAARRAYHEHERVLDARSTAQGRGPDRRDVPLLRRGAAGAAASDGASRRFRRRTASAGSAWSRKPRAIRATCNRTRSSRSSSSTTARRDTTMRCA